MQLNLQDDLKTIKLLEEAINESKDIVELYGYMAALQSKLETLAIEIKDIMKNHVMLPTFINVITRRVEEKKKK